MAVIPAGPGIARVLPEVQQNRVITTDPSLQARGAQQLASTVQQGAMNVLNEQQREDKALSRVKASNALFERETQISTINSDLAEQVRLGTLSHDKLEEAYQGAVAKLDPLQVDGLSEAEVEGMGLAQQRLQQNGQVKIRELAIGARKNAAAGDMATRFDLIGKEAAMPGADISKLNARLDSEDVDMAGRLAHGEMWPSIKQQVKDNNWSTQAAQRVIAARNDMGKLNQLEHDLTASDGLYAGKLDPNKLTTAMGQVATFKTQLENRQIAAQAKREAEAQRAMYRADQQISSGYPAPAGFMDKISAQVKGTPYESDFKSIVHDESEVQGVLRLPPGQQMDYLQKRQQDLMQNGGTVRQAAQLTRLGTAIGAGVKQMADQPLIWASNREGTTIEPLDIGSVLAGGGDTSAVTQQLSSRLNTIKAMQDKYGDTVKMKPLLPQEATAISAAIEKLGPEGQTQVLDLLHKAMPDSASYMGAIQQIRPDSPVTAIAGAIYGKRKEITTDTHWFRPNDVASSDDVSKTVLVGESIINKTKAAKAADGKGASFPYPESNEFNAGISAYVGEAYAGRPQAALLDQQSIKAAYVGRAAQLGDVSGVVNPQIMEWAVKATVGEIGDVNGVKTFAPWGMTADDFEDAAKAQLLKVVKDNKLGPAIVANGLSLKPVGDGQYLVYRGNRKQPSASGGDLIIKIGGDQ